MYDFTDVIQLVNTTKATPDPDSQASAFYFIRPSRSHNACFQPLTHTHGKRTTELILDSKNPYSKIKLFGSTYLSTRRTKPILISANSMPTKSAYLVATGAREKVNIIYLQGLHAKRAFHRVFLCIRTARHLHAS